MISTIVVACSSKPSDKSHEGHENHSSSQQQSQSELHIDFRTDPNTVILKTNTELIADIKQDNKSVTDARVEFEFWTKEGKKEKLKATPTTKSLYKSNHTFTVAGNYDVIVHVVTPQKHQMISAKFVVK